MAAPLVDRSPNDVVPASDHNDVKDYIEDGSYRVKTLYIELAEETGAPAGTKGAIYYNTSTEKFYQCKDGSTYVPLDGYTVTAKNSEYSVTASDCDGFRIFTNDGASDVVIFNLPAVSTGYKITFIVAENYELVITANGADLIYSEDETGGVKSVSNSTKGRAITLIGSASGKWMIQSDEGQWVVDTISKTISSDAYSLITVSNTIDQDGYIQLAIRDYGFIKMGTGETRIDYFDMTTTTGNGADGGDATINAGERGSCYGRSYGYLIGGTGPVNVIEYIDLSITNGDGSDKGDLIAAIASPHCSISSSTNGFIAGGKAASDTQVNTIQYIILDTTTGNSTDGGDLTVARSYGAGMNNSSYGFVAGGNSGDFNNVIDYMDLTITNDNAEDRGDLSQGTMYNPGCSGQTYGYSSGGYTSGGYTNVIDYIDLSSTTGNASDKGDLSAARGGHGSSYDSNGSYGFMGGGEDSGGDKNILDYIELDTTTGNAEDKGDLSYADHAVTGV